MWVQFLQEAQEVTKSNIAMGEKEEVKAAYMTAFAENSIRAIVERANKLEIKRENIVALLSERGQYVLVYYK